MLSRPHASSFAVFVSALTACDSMNDDTVARKIACLEGGGKAFLPLDTTDASGNDAGSTSSDERCAGE